LKDNIQYFRNVAAKKEYSLNSLGNVSVGLNRLRLLRNVQVVISSKSCELIEIAICILMLLNHIIVLKMGKVFPSDD
jgi:hypothetical protein